MQKIPVRLLSAVAAGTVLLSAFSFVTLNNAVKADSYRTDYTIYGDLNKDDVLDVFDLVLLREKINNKEYDKESDLDSDGILNENDLSLIKAAGIGIAVANADDRVKAAADYVTRESCDDDAIAAVIRMIENGTLNIT